MIEVIIAGVVAIGSAIINMVSANRQADAIEHAADEQRKAAEAMADAQRYGSDTSYLSTQIDALIANEKTKNTYAGVQIGVIITGIVIAGILGLVKRTKS
jgi:hypothetical protein